MEVTIPGTKVRVPELKKGISRHMFDGMFATGGLTLAQVALMTGLETYMVQNWIQRGYVAPPQKRFYTKRQFARIAIINMMREALQIDRICNMLSYINGKLHDESDDLIDDSELYHMYTDLVAEAGGIVSDNECILAAAKKVTENYAEPSEGAREKLILVLQIMANAHYTAVTRKNANELLAKLK